MLRNSRDRVKGIMMGLLYIFIYYVITFLVQTLFVLWQKSLNKYSTAEISANMVNSTYALSVIAAVISIWVYMIIGRVRKKPLYKVVKSEKSAPVVVGMAICLAFGMRFLVTVFYHFSQNLDALKKSIDEAAQLSPQLTGAIQWIVVVFAVVVMLPFFEEVLFRGVVMGEYLSIFRPWAAIIIQATLFGAAHMALFQSIFTFGVGVVLGIVYYKTQSIKIATVCHSAFNLSVILAQTHFTARSIILFSAFGILLVTFSLLYIIRYGRNIQK